MPVPLKLCCTFAAAALVMVAPASFAQQQPDTPADTQAVQPDDPTVSDTRVNSHITVIGAVRDPNASTEAVAEDESVPELPVVYEDDDAKVTAAADAPPASPAR